ncbi:hypothetical protein WJE45_24065, partial [Salmonella enterica subsp. enterica serovar Corvallis]
LHSERISSERSERFIQTDQRSVSVQHQEEEEDNDEGSAGREGLPEEVLAASLPLSGGEQRPAGGSSLQVHTDTFWFSIRESKPVLLQSLVLHMQEIGEEELCQQGAR